ncbi:hypothetical protein M413DRAFT_448736 [Hebeloma cylindrosporum]|uniref:Uncharacterized protein n=1 Tax=Hebeloma cylindrosporum TaxID=76867 RepID=A0A0C3BY75_HEBCY|nr:hypothetical protein M413DRAFT_448736 [Hebeloma cylindrosporum h7]
MLNLSLSHTLSHIDNPLQTTATAPPYRIVVCIPIDAPPVPWDGHLYTRASNASSLDLHTIRFPRAKTTISAVATSCLV